MANGYWTGLHSCRRKHPHSHYDVQSPPLICLLPTSCCSFLALPCFLFYGTIPWNYDNSQNRPVVSTPPLCPSSSFCLNAFHHDLCPVTSHLPSCFSLGTPSSESFPDLPAKSNHLPSTGFEGPSHTLFHSTRTGSLTEENWSLKQLARVTESESRQS